MTLAADEIIILVVDDSRFFRVALKQTIETKTGFTVETAEDFASALKIIADKGSNIFLALLDYNLPDAPNGEIIDFAVEQQIPSIVFSGSFNENMREELTHKDIVDYIVKNGPGCIETALHTVNRIYQNQYIKALVVDDSRFARKLMTKQLQSFKFNVLQAESAEQALELLKQHDDIKLVITDYNMPGMDGCELSERIRSLHSKNSLAIIGVSAHGNNILSTKFIKMGANDFLNKPYLKEELFCRVTQNMDFLEHIQALEDSLVTDYLTGLRNRRYLFERGAKIHKEAADKEQFCVAAMLDIDHFKSVNDTWGHDAGDLVLKTVSQVIKAHFGSIAIVARMGGEEFCVVFLANDLNEITPLFDAMRKDVESRVVSYGDEDIRVTISTGIHAGPTDSLDASLKIADEHLYEAKTGGRNRVVLK